MGKYVLCLRTVAVDDLLLFWRGPLRPSEHGHEGVLERLLAGGEALHGRVDTAVGEHDAGALDAALEEVLAPSLRVLPGALVHAFAGQVDLS